jgi:hypothetical protein
VLTAVSTVMPRVGLRPDPHMVKCQFHDRSEAEVIGTKSAAYPCRTQAMSNAAGGIQGRSNVTVLAEGSTK